MKWFKALFLVSSLLVNGCAHMMIPKDVSVTNTFDKSIVVYARSNPEQMPLIAEIRADRWKYAIQQTLERNTVFSQVFTTGSADYRLDVMEIRTKGPGLFFITAKSSTEMEWTLRDLKKNQVVWRETVTGKHEVGIFDSVYSLIGLLRARDAEFGAVRESIAAGTAKISALNL